MLPANRIHIKILIIYYLDMAKHIAQTITKEPKHICTAVLWYMAVQMVNHNTTLRKANRLLWTSINHLVEVSLFIHRTSVRRSAVIISNKIPASRKGTTMENK